MDMATKSKVKMIFVEIVITKIFQLLCIVLVMYMSYEQLLEYLKNEDSSSVSYRKFNQAEKDIYPSISICLHSTQGGIFDETSELKQMFATEDVISSTDEYHKMLIGQKDLSHGFKSSDFDQMTVDIVYQFVDISVSYTKEGREINPWYSVSNTSLDFPFYESYHDPYFNCITKRVEFVRNQILHYDYLVLNARQLYEYVSKFDNDTTLFLHVHHPGQLVREFGKQKFQLNRLDFENAMNGTNNYLEIHISDLEMVRRRFDSVSQCNDTLENEDHHWLMNVIDDVKCIPTYWKEIYLTQSQMNKQNTTLTNPDIPECNSSTQYANIHSNYLPPNNFDRVTRLYKEPCNRMRLTLNFLRQDKKKVGSSLILAFNYNIEEYRETLNHRAFGKILILYI